MNELGCPVVKDLLPLYADGVLSEESAALVSKHLESCADCRKAYEAVLEKPSVPAEKDAAPLLLIKKKMRKKKILTVVVTVIVTLVVLTSLFVALYHPVIFQRGDPIPYLKAAVKLAGGEPYAKVNVAGASAVYITRRGICDELISFIEESKGVPFVEQAGSAFLFSDGKYSLAVSTEIYLSRFTVWTVPENTRERIPES